MDVVFFMLGLCIGSFANVLVDRSISGESVVWGRSRCDWCHKTLRWYELIPLLSFFLQRGRCRRCHHALSFQYPLVELACALLAIALLPGSVAWYIIAISLLVLFVADVKAQLLPDTMLMVIGITRVIQLVSHPQSVMNFVVSGLGAGSFFLLLYLGTRGRGMGFGDVKLVAILGLLLGYPQIIIALYVAFLTGAVVGVILILSRRSTLKSAIAFGPFLIAGAVVAQLGGELIIHWWRTII